MLSQEAKMILDHALANYNNTVIRAMPNYAGTIAFDALTEIRDANGIGRVYVYLTDPGERRILTIKIIRSFTSLALKEAKDIIDRCLAPAQREGYTGTKFPHDKAIPVQIPPTSLVTSPSKFDLATADKLVNELQAAGAHAEIRYN